MEKETRISLCKELKSQYSCSQSVALAFADKTGVDAETLKRLTIGLSAGCGNMEGTCGAVTGAAVVAGLVLGNGAAARNAGKEVMEGFRKRNGATKCRTLKGIDTGKPLRSCADCCGDAADLLHEALEVWEREYK